MAKCVTEEVRNRKFELVSSSPSFDYEGAEFYERVAGLLNLREDVIQQIGCLLDTKRLPEAAWNNLARNLFEMIGEIMPDDPATAAQAVEAGLTFIDPHFNGPHYVTYKTRYNIVRCLERIHYSAPREPHYKHIREYRWDRILLTRSNIAAHAVRGFHKKTQRPGSLPPITFKRPEGWKPSKKERALDRKVSNALLSAVESVTLEELPMDAHFFILNCTYALIRWLPEVPELGAIRHLLAHRHMSTRTKQNIVYALFRRYGTRIPDEIRELPCLAGIWRKLPLPRRYDNETEELLRSMDTPRLN